MKVSLFQVLKTKNSREKQDYFKPILDYLKPLRQAYEAAHAGKADPYSSPLASKLDCWHMPDLYAYPAEGISPFTEPGVYYHA